MVQLHAGEYTRNEAVRKGRWNGKQRNVRGSPQINTANPTGAS
tara:strand:+ start:2001 stop:2129 length:129 start_codon:yes stop_codon:yes gene_type:complete